MSVDKNIRIHDSAEVSSTAEIGEGVSIWNNVQIRENSSIGKETNIGKNSYIDSNVNIGSRCKIQNNVSVFHGVTIKDGVFIGPHVCFTNDKFPRAINPDGSIKSVADWIVYETVVEYGAAIGAHSVILPGIRLGRFSMVSAGSVVTRDVPANGLVIGNPARLLGWVCDCGNRLEGEGFVLTCNKCEKNIEIDNKGVR